MLFLLFIVDFVFVIHRFVSSFSIRFLTFQLKQSTARKFYSPDAKPTNAEKTQLLRVISSTKLPSELADDERDLLWTYRYSFPSSSLPQPRRVRCSPRASQDSLRDGPLHSL